MSDNKYLVPQNLDKNLKLTLKMGNERHLWLAFLIILLLGIALRSYQLFSFRSLWVDEAMLARNVVDRSVGDLLRQPLDYNQGAPLLFLFFSKTATILFGQHDTVLRLLPFLSGILLLPCILYLAYKEAGWIAACAAGLLAAVNLPLIYFASEFKQYSSDALVGFGLLCYFSHLAQKDWEKSDYWHLAVAGILAAVFSHPALFVLAGCGVVLWFTELKKARDSRSFILPQRLSLIYLLWALTYLILYLLSFQTMAQNPYLLGYWEQGFMPQRFLEAITWLPTVFIELTAFLNYIPPAQWIMLLFLLAGVAFMWQRNRYLALSSVGILVALIVASALRLYPIRERMVTFTIPFVIFYLGAAVQWLVTSVKPYPRLSWLVALLAIASLSYGSLTGAWQLVQHPQLRFKEHTRPLIALLADEQQPAEPLYVYYGAEHAYAYYHSINQYPHLPVLVGSDHRGSPDAYLVEIQPLLENDTVWFLFARTVIIDGVDERLYILEYLNKGGVLVAEYTQPGAWLYKFRFASAQGN